jgi:hypothetical protein
MRKLPILLLLLACGQFAIAANPEPDAPPAAAAPQATPAQTVDTTPEGQVTIASRGQDVRQVLHDLFDQAGRNYVIESVPRIELFLSLTGVEFEEALQIICQIASLEVDVQNGIYYVTRRPPQPRLSVNPGPAAAGPAAAAPARPRGRLPDTVLQRRVTSRFTRTDLRTVIADLARQTNVRIRVAEDVPRYLLNASLVNASLGYGLDLIAQAANLEYEFTDEQSIVLRRADPNRVSVVQVGATQRAAP